MYMYQNLKKYIKKINKCLILLHSYTHLISKSYEDFCSKVLQNNNNEDLEI